METFDAYLVELKSYFSDATMDVYDELAEDLREQVQELMAEGVSEAEATKRLASPVEIASDFFADRRFETAQSAEGDLVPEEEVEEIFKEARRKAFYRRVQKMFHGMKRIVTVVLALLGTFFVAYIGQELFLESHLARIPLIGLLISLGLTLLIWPNKSTSNQPKRWLLVGTLGLIGLGVFIEGMLSNQLFYKGKPHFQEITAQGTEGLSFILDSDAMIEISTSEVGATENFRVLFDGNFKKQDIKEITKNDGKKKIDLRIDKKNLFNLFTQTKESEIVVLIPKGATLAKFELDLLKGDLRLLDLATKDLILNLIEGDLFSKNIEVEHSAITSIDGDIVIEDSDLDGSISNKDGKTILSHLIGDLRIAGSHGHSIIKDLTSTDSELKTIDGKITIEDSQIDVLKSYTDSGQNVVARTTGDLELTSNRGKIVSEANRGELHTRNDSGVTIVINTASMPSDVSSKSGFIKWIHDLSQPVHFDVRSQTGEARNELPVAKGGALPTVSIQSESGDIRVIEKIN